MEKKSKPAELSRALRAALGGLTQSELATRLLLSRNYISHIEAGLKLPSVRILAQMEAMLTEATSKGGPREHTSQVVEESQAPYLPSGAGGLSDSALAITEEIQAKFFAAVAAANGDPSRLGWINEQLAQHLRPPAHWPKITPHVGPTTGVVVPQEPARHPQRRSATG